MNLRQIFREEYKKNSTFKGFLYYNELKRKVLPTSIF